MKQRVVYILLVIIGLLGTSCSKTDESFTPSTPTPQQSIWVNYTHTVPAGEENIEYEIQYLSSQGLQTVYNHTGSFSVRVPVQRFDSAGATYSRTLLSIKTKGSDAAPAPTINSAMKIASDYGFIIAQTYNNANGCGVTQRTIAETRPLSWLTIK